MNDSVIIEEKEMDDTPCEKHASLPHRIIAGTAVLAGFGANIAPLPEKTDLYSQSTNTEIVREMQSDELQESEKLGGGINYDEDTNTIQISYTNSDTKLEDISSILIDSTGTSIQNESCVIGQVDEDENLIEEIKDFIQDPTYENLYDAVIAPIREEFEEEGAKLITGADKLGEKIRTLPGLSGDDEEDEEVEATEGSEG